MLGLLAAFALTGPLARSVERRFPLPPMNRSVLIWPSRPNGQFRCYVFALGIALACVAIFALGRHLVRRRRRLSLAIDAAVAASAVLAGFVAAPFLGCAALALSLPLAALLLPHASRGYAAERESAPRVLDTWAMLVETICLFWGAWITTRGTVAANLSIAVTLVACFIAWRVRRLLKALSLDEALRQEAVSGLPLLALPTIGILRAPSPLFVVAALACYVALSVGHARSLRALARLPRALPALAALWALTAIYGIPHKFRELPRINHNSHEAGKYAWLNSFYHGKLFMADTALLYGPLRELVLAVYVALAGKTAEQVRAGQIVIHLGFLALMLVMGWIAGRRRLWAVCWFAFLVITSTLALPWLDALHLLAFGWSDLGRIAFPMLTVFGALEMASSSRALAAWGAAAGLSVLYSQETGPTAVAAITVALAVDALMAPATLTGRWKRGGRAVGLFLGGVAASWVFVVGLYALFGRAGQFLGTIYKFVTLFASGSLGGVPFPLSERTFLSWSGLTARAPRDGVMLEYALPPAIYAVAGAALIAIAATRRWTPRARLMLGLLGFGVGSFRVAMGRSDYYHLITVTAPAVALLVALVADAARDLSRARLPFLPAVPASALLILPLLYASSFLSGVDKGFKPRTLALLNGKEAPSIGPPFAYPDIPRAGDIFLPPDTLALTRAIQRRTGPQDKIFVYAGFIDGAELYFLADRVNPTRCDLLAEIVDTEVQDELRRDLQRDPPALVMGPNIGMFNKATVEYLRAGWREVERVGQIPIAMRISSPGKR